MTFTTEIFAGPLGLGAPELIVILIILLVLFGGSKLPSLAKGLGQSVKEFKKATKEGEEAVEGSKPVVEAKKTEPAKTTGAN
jgi:sec-independent protein translocase protein TatA